MLARCSGSRPTSIQIDAESKIGPQRVANMTKSQVTLHGPPCCQPAPRLANHEGEVLPCKAVRTTQEELDNCRTAVAQQLSAYSELVNAIGSAATDEKVPAALEGFEPFFFSNMTLVLDRYFVHRLRTVTGKDGNPLNEVEMLCDSLMSNNGILRGNNVIKFTPEQSVLKLNIGDPIRLTAEQFGRLSAAFFAEIERKFV